jgi:hypothetical protein
MKVGELTKVLEGIASGLAAISKQASNGLASFHAGLQPFAEQTVEQFVTFLNQCDEYKRNGTIATGGRKPATRTAKSTMTVQGAAESVRGVLAEIDGGTVTSARIDTLLGEIKKGLSKPQMDELLVTLNISGKAKSKEQAADKVRQVLNNQLEMYVKNQALDRNRQESVDPQLG